MREKSLILIICLLMLTIMSCEKQANTNPQQPEISLSSIVNTSNNQVEVGVDLIKMDGNSVDDYGVVWSDIHLPTVNNSKLGRGMTVENHSITIDINNLKSGGVYYFRAYFVQNNQVTYSDETSITVQNNVLWTKLPNIQSIGTVPTEYRFINNGAFSIVLKSIYTEAIEIWSYTDYKSTWSLYRDDITLPMRYSAIILQMNAQNVYSPTTLWGGGYYTNDKLPDKKVYLKDFYNGSPFSGVGSERTDFPGDNVSVECFSTSQKNYVLETAGNMNLWEYDDNLLFWTKKAALPAQNIAGAATFSDGKKGYVMVEYPSGKKVDFFEYNPAADHWTKKADFPGDDRTDGFGFGYNGNVYYGAGQTKGKSQGLRDIWQYNIIQNQWQKSTDYPGKGTKNLVTLPANNGGIYVGFGFQVQTSSIGTGIYNPALDLWQFSPK